jgi:hypothetical protein
MYVLNDHFHRVTTQLQLINIIIIIIIIIISFVNKECEKLLLFFVVRRISGYNQKTGCGLLAVHPCH